MNKGIIAQKKGRKEEKREGEKEEGRRQQRWGREKEGRMFCEALCKMSSWGRNWQVF